MRRRVTTNTKALFDQKSRALFVNRREGALSPLVEVVLVLHHLPP